MSNKVYGFNSESDIRRIGAAVKVVEKIHSTGMQAPTHVKQDATYAIITELIDGSSEDDNGKQAKGTEVYFDGATFDYIAITVDPIVYDNDASLEDGATVFATSNITGKSAMAVGDVVNISHYPNLSETSDWVVNEGGSGVRAYVVITSSASASTYTGNVLKGPGQSSIVKTSVSIKVFGATENPLSVGYANFADLVDGVYYLNGDLLS